MGQVGVRMDVPMDQRRLERYPRHACLHTRGVTLRMSGLVGGMAAWGHEVHGAGAGSEC